MTDTPAKRWPMCGPPTRAATEPPGDGPASPPPTTDAITTSALAAAVAVMTARQQGLPVTVSELTEDADLTSVARLLAVVACALLDRLSPDRGAGLLAQLGAAAAAEGNQP